MYKLKAVLSLDTTTLTYQVNTANVDTITLDQLAAIDSSTSIDTQLILHEQVQNLWYRLDAVHLPSGLTTVAAHFTANGDYIIRECVLLKEDATPTRRALYRDRTGKDPVKFYPVGTDNEYHPGGHIGANTPNLLITGKGITENKCLVTIGGLTLPCQSKQGGKTICEHGFDLLHYTGATTDMGLLDLSQLGAVAVNTVTAADISVNGQHCNFRTKHNLFADNTYIFLLLNGKFLPVATTPSIRATGEKQLTLDLSQFDIADHYLETKPVLEIDLPITHVEGSNAVVLHELYQEPALKALFGHFTTNIVYLTTQTRLEFETITLNQSLNNRFPTTALLGGAITDNKGRLLPYALRVADKWTVVDIAVDPTRRKAYRTSNLSDPAVMIDDTFDLTTRIPREEITLRQTDLRTFNFWDVVLSLK